MEINLKSKNFKFAYKKNFISCLFRPINKVDKRLISLKHMLLYFALNEAKGTSIRQHTSHWQKQLTIRKLRFNQTHESLAYKIPCQKHYEQVICVGDSKMNSYPSWEWSRNKSQNGWIMCSSCKTYWISSQVATCNSRYVLCMLFRFECFPLSGGKKRKDGMVHLRLSIPSSHQSKWRKPIIMTEKEKYPIYHWGICIHPT